MKPWPSASQILDQVLIKISKGEIYEIKKRKTIEAKVQTHHFKFTTTALCVILINTLEGKKQVSF